MINKTKEDINEEISIDITSHLAEVLPSGLYFRLEDDILKALADKDKECEKALTEAIRLENERIAVWANQNMQTKDNRIKADPEDWDWFVDYQELIEQLQYEKN